jgi:hypothetical protein
MIALRRIRLRGQSRKACVATDERTCACCPTQSASGHWVGCGAVAARTGTPLPRHPREITRPVPAPECFPAQLNVWGGPKEAEGRFGRIILRRLREGLQALRPPSCGCGRTRAARTTLRGPSFRTRRPARCHTGSAQLSRYVLALA